MFGQQYARHFCVRLHALQYTDNACKQAASKPVIHQGFYTEKGVEDSLFYNITLWIKHLTPNYDINRILIAVQEKTRCHDLRKYIVIMNYYYYCS